MKYDLMCKAMWKIFDKSFVNELNNVFKYNKQESKEINKKAKIKYKEILKDINEFEKEDRFKMNIISCAMFASFVLSMPKKPSLFDATIYYNNAMMTKAMVWFCKKSGKKKYSPKDIEGLKKQERLNAADRNPYSWNMKLFLYEDQSGYEARFYKCGICTLMKKVGLYDLTPALCKLDYAMAEAGGRTNFIRQYTLATSGPYCDCGYKKKN